MRPLGGGNWLRRLSDEVHHSFERQLAARNMTAAQWNILVSAYHREGITGHGATNRVGRARRLGCDRWSLLGMLRVSRLAVASWWRRAVLLC